MSSPPENKLVLSDISSSSWSSRRSATPKPSQNEASDQRIQSLMPKLEQGGDHVVSHSNRLSFRSYPKDCPPLTVHWYHAVDVSSDQVIDAKLAKPLLQVPKRKPVLLSEENKTSEKPPQSPKKYVPFSKTDSRAIEAAFQKWVEQEEAAEKERLICGIKGRGFQGQQCREPFKVPVNEDYLFDVDVEKRELIPAYWLGPVYDVRRGTWFSQGLTYLNPAF
jgi:hypothetical protein